MALTKIDDRGVKYPVDLLDNEKIRFGTTDNDLEIYHNGTDSYIKDTGTGDLYIEGDNYLVFRNNAGTENKAKFISNGACELYHNNIKTIATSANGVTFTGAEGSSCELYIFADEGDDNADKWRINALSSDSILQIGNYNNGSGYHTNIECNGSGNVELYYANVKKFETTASGVTITGSQSKIAGDIRFDNTTTVDKDIYWDESEDRLNFFDSVYATFGNSSDMQIYHNGGNSNSYIDNIGSLNIRATGNIEILNKTGDEPLAKFVPDGNCELYSDNAKKFETTATGIKVIGADSNDQIKIIAEGTNAYGTIDFESPGTGGGWIKVQGEDAIKLVKDGAVELYHDGSKTCETRANGINVSDSVNTASGNLYLGAAGTTTHEIADSAQMRIKRSNSNTVDIVAIKGAHWGYSTGAYAGVRIGNPSVATNSTIFMGVDVESNASGAFTGDGREVVFRNNHKFIVPNAANDGYVVPMTLSAGAATEGVPRFKQGILFDSNTADVNILDDYEEGTCTITMTPQSSGTMTLDTDIRTLQYTKIGRCVHIFGRVKLASSSSPSGTVVVGGLPFTQSDLVGQTDLGQFNVSYHGGDLPSDAVGPVALEFTNSGTNCYLVYMRDNASWAGWDGADFDSNAGDNYLALSGWYLTNQ